MRTYWCVSVYLCDHDYELTDDNRSIRGYDDDDHSRVGFVRSFAPGIRPGNRFISQHILAQ